MCLEEKTDFFIIPKAQGGKIKNTFSKTGNPMLPA